MTEVEGSTLRAKLRPDSRVHSSEIVAKTTPAKWDAFVKGVKAGEFDHFVEGVED